MERVLGIEHPATRAARDSLAFWANGIKLRWHWQGPEDDPGQGRELARLAGLAGLVPAAAPLGLALMPPARALGHEAGVPGDLEGQVGGEVVTLASGESCRGR